MDNITILDHLDLSAFITTLKAMDIPVGAIHTLRFHQREDGIAFKVNSGTWSPTIGRRADEGGY